MFLRSNHLPRLILLTLVSAPSFTSAQMMMGGQGECPQAGAAMNGMMGMGQMMGSMMGIGQQGMAGNMASLCPGGMMGDMGMGGLGMLNLSPEQQIQITGIQDKLRKDLWAIEGKMLDARANLRDALAAERPDPKKVGQAFGAVADLQRQMVEANVAAQNQVMATLTDEQRQRLRSGAGMGGMMGPGTMQPGMHRQ